MRLAARTQKRQWSVRPADKRAEALARELMVSPLTAQILLNRGVDSVEACRSFLEPKLTALIAPELMPGVAEAVKIIRKSIEAAEKITIYGDYDVDGITSVSILSQMLEYLNAQVDFYIPHRVEEGYGLNCQAIESLAAAGTKLLITVDCGITAIEAAAKAAELGMKLVITDHHQPGAELPAAEAIVHPALDGYANPDSAGVMVAFKLAWALANDFNPGRKLSNQLREFMLNATSLAAMGTVADIVDLRGENRILTSFGLKSLPGSNLVGVKALIESAGLSGQGLDTCDIGFRLAPLLNAAGRMGHARLAVELLTNDSPMRSMQIAGYLKQQNELRRKHERQIFQQAREMVVQKGLNHPDNRTIVLAAESWHTGIIGIVASRLVDRFYRPSIMLNADNGMAQGSGRSVAGFDMLKAIKACSKYLERFGGHRAAAGLSLKTKNIGDFAKAFEEYARENVTEAETVETLDIDACARLKQLSHKAVTELDSLAPFGPGNSAPMLVTRGVRLCTPPRKVGSRQDHLQIAVTDNTASIRCIAFGMGKMEKKLLENEYFNIAYSPQLNTFKGVTNVQLVIEDIQFD